MKSLDPLARKRQCVERLALAACGGGADFGWRDAQAHLGQIDAVEAAAQIRQRGIAAGDHIRDDIAHDAFHVGRGLALGGEKCSKARGEIGGSDVETNRHTVVLQAQSKRK